MAKKKIEQKEVYTYNCPFCKIQHTDSNGCPECSKVKAPTVELVSYSIKAIIPTGSYANVQPEIIVKAKNLEEAEAYVIPHINKLFNDFLNKSERKEFVHPYAVSGDLPTTFTHGTSGLTAIKTVDVSGTYPKIPKKRTGDFNPETQEAHYTTVTAEMSQAFMKAEQAINSCLSFEAMELIQNKITDSVKLTDKEKEMLIKLSGTKIREGYKK